jgi:hypothetical protein
VNQVGGIKLLRAAKGLGLAMFVAAVAVGLLEAPRATAGTCSNDNLACAETLPNTPGTAAIAVTAAATPEPMENAHAGFGPVRSVWYRWTAPSSGDFTAQTCETPNASFDSVLGVYADGAAFPLTEIASNDDGCGFSGLQSRVHFAATSGTQYLVAVDSKSPSSGKLTIDKAPANDDLVQAEDLGSSLPVAVDGATNRGATQEGAENDHAGDAGGASVWYEWKAPATGSVVIETCGSAGVDVLDTLLAVYADGMAFPLTPIVSNDNGVCGQQSRVVLPTTANTTYLIAVDGRATGVLFPPDQGSFDLKITSSPSNDDFADAEAITGALPLSASGTTAGATAETGEPDHAGIDAFSSVWYTWTPQAEGDIAIDTCSSALDARLAVYTGSVLNALTEVDSDLDSCSGPGNHGRVDFHATQQPYLIAVDSGGNTGPIDVDIAVNDSTDPAAPTLSSKITRKRGKARFTFSGTDDLTAPGNLDFTCKLDAKPSQPCTSPITYKKLKRGTHTFKVRATDESGNTGPNAAKTFRSSRR